MELTISLAVLAAAGLLLVFLRWRESRPVELGTIRHVPYMLLMVLCAVVILIDAGHLVVVLMR